MRRGLASFGWLIVLGCSSSAAPSDVAGGGAPSNHAGDGGANATAGTTSVVTDVGGASAAGASAGGASDVGAGTAGASGGVSGLGAAGNGGGEHASGGAGTAGSGGESGSASGGAGAGGNGGATASPGIRLVGRTATASGSAVRFSWPGVSVRARFTGTSVSLTLNDGNNANRFTVVIDGGTPKTITTTSAQTLLLASGLANTTHDLVVWRNTEASPGGITQLSGLADFGAGGALLAAAAAPDRRLEVIGDSLSVGAGVEGTSTTCNPGIDAFTNNYLAYGSVAARAVNADVATIAWSGIGVYRSYGGTAPTMPQRYDYAIPNDQTPWDFSRYQPQAVIINLGTNDFSAGNPGQPYIDAYVVFVKHVRSKYADARFILIDMYGGDRLTAINSVVSTLKSGGETRVEALSFSSVPNNNTACNGHPNATAQAAMGSILATRLKSLLGW